MAANKSTKKRLGEFAINRELGRGGMGIACEARRISLNRKVALKVRSGSCRRSSKAVLRFQRGAQAAGIHSTGDDGRSHYCARELIDGPSRQPVVRSLSRVETNGPKVSDTAATMAVASAPAAQASGPVLASSGAAEAPAWVSEILSSPPVSAAYVSVCDRESRGNWARNDALMAAVSGNSLRAVRENRALGFPINGRKLRLADKQHRRLFVNGCVVRPSAERDHERKGDSKGTSALDDR